ncbi:MAG: LysM peptidoglycan-binding domain-containing M23 family metallopeptidase [Alphaproteobacteria bacterium]|nr:LysM peptidoglycan-binding domain-containing M23 family metallopeptidase [Alphaproteobacteria bacterium]
MRKILLAIFLAVVFAACDLQPKITSLPDTVGDFISTRYPALLADPSVEPEIYNSAAGDYGVYASPELYGSVDMEDYVNYADVSDYVLINDADEKLIVIKDIDSENEESSEISPEADESEEETVEENQLEEADVLDVPEYKTDEINVPLRAATGTVVVRRGDTLYAIARENNMTLDEIARANNISAPYTIRIGQVLKVVPEQPVKAAEVKNDTPKDTVEKVAPASPKEEKIVVKAVQDVRVPLKDVKVEHGDTLYSISRKYSVPVNDLAVMNGLSAPFTLSVGQTLRVPDLATSINKQAKADVVKSDLQKPNVTIAKESKNSKSVVKGTNNAVAEKNKAQTTKKTNVKKAENKKVVAKKDNTKKLEQSKKGSDTKKSVKQKSEPVTPKIAARSSSKFLWPVRGTILSHYGAKTGGLYNDGINISAALNTAVSAAENGIVAYAGNEVRGMGNLVIIQHADGWMTVYAHMNSMTVRRGAHVTVGQKIGTVGQTGKVTTPQLHFEIRKGTKAYNPINYLKK